MLVLVINCLSNLELQRRRNVVKVVKIGCGGVGVEFGQNLKEKQFFLRREENIQRGKRTTLFRK